MSFSELQAKNVALLGLGEEGLSFIRRMMQLQPEKQLTIYSEHAVDPSLIRTLDPNRHHLVIGPLQAGRLIGHQVLVRSPGVSPYRAALRAAAGAGVKVTTASNLWFAENPGANTICITGTKGKSTTTALVHHLLGWAGIRSAIGGNYGRCLLDCDRAEADWWVIELSSYQLCDLQAAPSLAAILNLSDEHLDWHRGLHNYQNDKLRLGHLSQEGRLLLNYGDRALKQAASGWKNVDWFEHPDHIHHRDRSIYRGNSPLLDPVTGPLLGTHNLVNLAAALSIVEKVTELPESLRPALDSFEPLPHRMREVAEVGGLKFIDDSLSTTPVATLAALEALQGQAVTVLVGGFDRGLDWSQWMGEFEKAHTFALIGMPDTGHELIRQFEAAGVCPEGGLHCAQNLSDAVHLARQLTPRQGIVLLSPGAPSFPQFANYQERGEAFLAAAKTPP